MAKSRQYHAHHTTHQSDISGKTVDDAAVPIDQQNDIRAHTRDGDDDNDDHALSTDVKGSTNTTVAIKTLTKPLRKQLSGIKLTYPLVMTDGSNRTWLVQDSKDETPQEFFGHPPDFGTKWRSYVLHSTEQGQDIPRGTLKLNDSGGSEPCSAGSPRADHNSKGLTTMKTKAAGNQLVPAKRQRSSNSPTDDRINEYENEQEDFFNNPFEPDSVLACNIRPVIEDILRKIQQKGLKILIKAWLKICHPAKQANFPYNGGKLAEQRATDGDADYDPENPGEKSAPDYWPSQQCWKVSEGGTGCRHREPDHIYKNERVNVCVAILCAGRRFKDAQFDIDRLEEATMKITREHPGDFHPDADKLIKELYRARRKQIEYEMGCIDADTLVKVLRPSKPPPKVRRAAKSRKPSIKSRQSTPDVSDTLRSNSPVHNASTMTSSFTSSFASDPIKVESNLTSPIASATFSSQGTSASSSATTLCLDQGGSQDSSQYSSLHSGFHNIGRDYNSDYAESVAETEPLDEIIDPDEVDLVDTTPRPALQKTHPTDSTPSGLVMSRHPSQTALGQMNPSSVAPTALQNNLYPNQTIFPVYHGLPGPNLFTQSAVPYPPTQQEEQFISPTDTYMDSKPHLNIHPDSVTPTPNNSASHTPWASSFTDSVYSLDLLSTAPQPANYSTFANSASMGSNGYPSVASSDFNGCMPVDSDWHTVDHSWSDFYDASPASRAILQHQHRTASDASRVTHSLGGIHPGRVMWASDFQAMAGQQRPSAQPMIASRSSIGGNNRMG